MMPEEKLKTGTTTVGIIYKDGVVLATESKSTMGYLVASKTSQKIYSIDDNIAVTTAGGSGDTQALVRISRAEINLYKLSRNAEITVKAAATLLSNILSNNRWYPYMAMLIIGGYDKTGPHLYSTDAVGGTEEEEKFTSTGSGSPMAFGVLEDSYRDNMTKEDAIKLAVRAVRAAKERDIGSGGQYIHVVVMDKTGMQTIDHDQVNEVLKQLIN